MKTNIRTQKFGVKQALLALFLLVIILLVGRTAQLVYQLFQPLHLDSAARGYNLNFEHTQNLIFASFKDPKNPHLFLVSFIPQEDRIIVLKIANDIYTDLPKSLGQWQIGSVYQLGQENSPPQGVSLLKLSLSKLVGLPIDAIFINDVFAKENPQAVLNTLKRNPYGQLQFILGLKTDLNVIEVIKYLSSASSVRADKVLTLDLAASNITESKLLPDSSRVLGVNVVKLDTFIRDKMADNSITDEGKTIAIFNGTNHPGLAIEASRFVTNLGGNVVITQTLESKLDQTLVVNSPEDEETTTVVRLKEFFAPECSNKPCNLSDPKITSSRAQVNIILGEDFFNYWYK